VPTQIATKGPVYWLYMAYVLGLIGSAVVILFSSYKNRALNFRNTLVLIVGLLIPSITATLFVLDLLPVRGFDWTSTSFIFQVALYIWAILRRHLFDVVPIARTLVMENMDDLVIVTNQRGYVVDFNRAAQRTLGLSPSIMGTAPDKLPQPWAAFFQNHTAPAHKGEVFLNLRDSQRDFELTISPLLDKNNQMLGRLLLLHDITERKQAEKNLQQQNEYFSILHQITLDFLNYKEPESLLNNIAERAAFLVNAQHGFIFLPNEASLVLRAATEGFLHNIGNYEPKPGAGVLRQVWESKQTFVIENYHSWEFRDLGYEGDSLYAVAGVPITVGDNIIGVLEVANINDTRIFNDAELEILNRFAALAALVLGNVQLYGSAQHELIERKHTEEKLHQLNKKLQFQLEQIQLLQSELHEQTIRDPLTGLYNRRYLKEMLGRELAIAEREAYPVSFVMMDLDHFKNINDTFGHNTGDRILQSLAAQLLGQARTGDIVCRYGGEEILAILPNVSVEIAFQITERWRTSFQISNQESRVFLENEETQATISCGISTFPLDGTTSDELIYTADKAMYRAKEKGRNQTVIWHNPFN
jgi:diguanylate cyclase (GGDEF)-like protein/PAS domain S-box-containing protein